MAAHRGVAQPGSALRSGRRGPQFESGHPDCMSYVVRAATRTARTYRATAAALGRPAGSSAANAVVPRSVLFCHEIALPASCGIGWYGSPDTRANAFSIRRSPPDAHTMSRCWWNHTVRWGCRRRMSACAMRASRSDNARGPDSYTPPIGRQRHGKFRLRSTPCPFFRVSAATPSGLSTGTIQRSRSRGAIRSNARAIGIPPVSLPCTQPTTSTGVPCGLPTSYAWIGRPCQEWPSTTAVSASALTKAVQPGEALDEEPNERRRRKADDVEVVALDPLDERRAASLDRVPAGASFPFAGREVRREVARRQSTEGDERGLRAHLLPCVRAQAQARHDLVSASREELEHLLRRSLVRRLPKHGAAAAHDGVDADDRPFSAVHRACLADGMLERVVA